MAFISPRTELVTDKEARCYLSRNPDLMRAYGLDNVHGARTHYREVGYREGRTAACSLDDLEARRYLDYYPDLKSAYGQDIEKAKDHWIQHGWREGRIVPSNAKPHLGITPVTIQTQYLGKKVAKSVNKLIKGGGKVIKDGGKVVKGGVKSVVQKVKKNDRSKDTNDNGNSTEDPDDATVAPDTPPSTEKSQTSCVIL